MLTQSNAQTKCGFILINEMCALLIIRHARYGAANATMRMVVTAVYEIVPSYTHRVWKSTFPSIGACTCCTLYVQFAIDCILGQCGVININISREIVGVS